MNMEQYKNESKLNFIRKGGGLLLTHIKNKQKENVLDYFLLEEQIYVFSNHKSKLLQSRKTMNLDLVIE